MSGHAHVMFWTAGCCLGFASAVAVLRLRGVLAWKTIAALLWAVFGLMLGGVWQARLEVMPVGEALSIGPADVLAGGGRIPLGLATGAVLAAVWCAVVRAPWWPTGDALAVAAPVVIILGRFGCLAAGCCTGTVCGDSVPHFLCTPVGRDSEVFARQYAQGLIDPTSAIGLPIHPLPIYFMVLAAVVLAVLLWQLRHGSRPGSLLVAFGLLWPVGKLALEQLRETPRPPGLATWVPLVMFSASALMLVLRRAINPAGPPDPV